MVWLQVAPVASELLPVAWVFMVFADPRGQRVATRGLGFHGFCRVLSVASGKITGSSGYSQGLVRGKGPKPMVFMVFAGSCQASGHASRASQVFAARPALAPGRNFYY